MKIDYRVLAGATAQSLEEQVNDLCNDGYMPQGGVAVAVLKDQPANDGEVYLSGPLYTQAMVKVEQ
jgi:hypothetical protein